MNKNATNAEKIDAFLSGKMTPKEMLDFQTELNNNAMLQKEFAFQNTVVSGIKEARRLELKNRLSQIPVDDKVGYPSYYKFLIGAASAVVVGSVVSYFWIFNDSHAIETQQKDTVSVVSTPQIGLQDSETSKVLAPKENIQTAEPSVSIEMSGQAEEKNQLRSKNKKSNDSKEIKKSNQPTDFAVQVPDAHLEMVNEVEVSEVNILQNSNSAAIENDGNMPAQVNIEKNRKYKLHYSYYENQLYLYGDFDKEPYELIDLKVTNNKGLYMYYQQKYYQLVDNTRSIAPLKEVKESDLIYKLEQLRNQ
jgi:hypothetical protein